LLISLLTIPPGTALEAAASRTLSVGNVEEGREPQIDGLVTDDAWLAVDPYKGFTQQEPNEGAPASEETEVRILLGRTTLYIGIIAFDSEPDKILVTESRRDGELNETDSIQIVLDTFNDNQNAFLFGTNPVGLEYDGQVAAEGQTGGFTQTAGQRGSQRGGVSGYNPNWDGDWTVRSAITERGWETEMAIPLKTLRYEPGEDRTWGFNVVRNIRRKNEQVFLAPIPRGYSVHRVSLAAKITELDLPGRRDVKVTPFGGGRTDEDNLALVDQRKNQFDVGVDVKWGVTPNMTADFTANTDFAQVESDEQQVNLTRFPLFFPEKRPFFLENAGNFAMGQNQSVELFFSRRIGIGPSGEIVPILGGARMSGKAGQYNLGVLNMQTDEVVGVTAANNYTVASLSRELPNRSSIGALFVNRLTTGDLAGEDDWNRTYGFDGKLGIGEPFTLSGYAARTDTPGLEGREHALNLRGEYQKRQGRVWLGFTEVGDSFNPEVGFLTRDDYRNLETGFFLNIRNDISWLRELRPHITYRGFWDFDGFKETEQIHFDSHVDFENGAFFSPAFNRTVEGLTEPFEIYPGIVVPPGAYSNWEAAWRWNTNLARPLSYEGGLDYGGFLSGDRRGYESTVNFRYRSKVITSLTWRYNDIDLLEGSFVTNLGQVKVSYNFTPLIYLQALVQYNDRIDAWSSNVRFSWLNTAGTGLFLVYNDTEGLGDVLIGPQNRSFIVKYTHQFDIFR